MLDSHFRGVIGAVKFIKFGYDEGKEILDDSHFLHVAWNAFGDRVKPSLGTVDLEVVALAFFRTAPHHDLVVESCGSHKHQHCH